MVRFTTKPLGEATWRDFEALVERHNGVFGGCWCLGFHAEGKPGTLSYEARREAKRSRVWEGNAHAALVYDGDRCVGWCQFGSPDELPRIKNKKMYEAELQTLPRWRLTCFFVDRRYRKQGVAVAALGGALKQIAKLGGGVVEGYPEDTSGGAPPMALHAGTLTMFERAGFAPDRQIGKNKWVMRSTVRPTR